MKKIINISLVFCFLLIANQASATSKQLITNGSFENDISSWECQYNDYCSTFSNSDGVGRAKKGANFLYLSGGSNISDETESLIQTVEAPKWTKSLRLTFYYKFYLEEDEDLNDGFFSTSLESGSKSYIDDFWPTDYPENSKWKKYTKTVNNPKLAGKNIDLNFYVAGDWPWSTSVDIDSVSLKAFSKYKFDKPANLEVDVNWEDSEATWNKVSKAKYYKVQLRSDSGDPIKKWSKVKKNSVKLYKYLDANKNYKIKTKVCRGKNCSKWTKYTKFNTNKYFDDEEEEIEEDITEEPAEEDNNISSDCSYNKYNCSDFNNQSEAQSMYDKCIGEVGYDIHDLDRDGNSLACESLS